MKCEVCQKEDDKFYPCILNKVRLEVCHACYLSVNAPEKKVGFFKRKPKMSDWMPVKTLEIKLGSEVVGYKTVQKCFDKLGNHKVRCHVEYFENVWGSWEVVSSTSLSCSSGRKIIQERRHRITGFVEMKKSIV